MFLAVSTTTTIVASLSFLLLLLLVADGASASAPPSPASASPSLAPPPLRVDSNILHTPTGYRLHSIHEGRNSWHAARTLCQTLSPSRAAAASASAAHAAPSRADDVDVDGVDGLPQDVQLDLCPRVQICPSGPESPPVDGVRGGEVWTPVLDGVDDWLALGDHVPEAICRLRRCVPGQVARETQRRAQAVRERRRSRDARAGSFPLFCCAVPRGGFGAFNATADATAAQQGPGAVPVPSRVVSATLNSECHTPPLPRAELVSEVAEYRGKLLGDSAKPGPGLSFSFAELDTTTITLLVSFAQEIDAASVDVYDIGVVSPFSFSHVSHVADSVAYSPETRVAAYTFRPPLESWRLGDAGTWKVLVHPSELFDLSGHQAVPDGDLGTFRVHVSPQMHSMNADASMLTHGVERRIQLAEGFVLHGQSFLQSSISWRDAAEHCASRSTDELQLTLCPQSTVCPLGPRRPPVGGVGGPFEEWVPVFDGDNQWVSLSTSDDGTQLCRERKCLGLDAPRWGAEPNVYSFKGRVFCCRAPPRPDVRKARLLGTRCPMHGYPDAELVAFHGSVIADTKTPLHVDVSVTSNGGKIAGTAILPGNIQVYGPAGPTAELLNPHGTPKVLDGEFATGRVTVRYSFVPSSSSLTDVWTRDMHSGTYQVWLPQGQLRDRSGGKNPSPKRLGDFPVSVTGDGLPPVLDEVHIEPATLRTSGKITVTFTASEPLYDAPTVFFFTDTDHRGGRLAMAVMPMDEENTQWRAMYEAHGDEPSGPVRFVILAADLSGNKADPHFETTDGSASVFDGTPPKLRYVSVRCKLGEDEQGVAVVSSRCSQGGLVQLLISATETITTPRVFFFVEPLDGAEASGAQSESASRGVPPSHDPEPLGQDEWLVELELPSDWPSGRLGFSIDASDSMGNFMPRVTEVTDGSAVVLQLAHAGFQSIDMESSNKQQPLTGTPGDVVTLRLLEHADHPVQEGSLQVTFFPLSENPMQATVTRDSSRSHLWKASFTVSKDMPPGPVSFSATSRDTAGNVGTVTATSSGVAVELDVLPLEVLRVSASSSNVRFESLASPGDTITVSFATSKMPVLHLVKVRFFVDGEPGEVREADLVQHSHGLHFSADVRVRDTDPQGDVSFEIAVADAVGATATLASRDLDDPFQSVTIETQGLSFLHAKVRSNGAHHHLRASVGDLLTLTFTTSKEPGPGSLRVEFLMPGGKRRPASVTAMQGLDFQSTVVVQRSDKEGPIQFVIRGSDQAGNERSVFFAAHDKSPHEHALVSQMGADQTLRLKPRATVVIDRTPPHFAQVQLSSDNELDSHLARTHNVITVDFTVSEKVPLDGVGVRLFDGAHTVDVAVVEVDGEPLPEDTADLEGERFVAKYTVRKGDPEGMVRAMLTVRDMAGNAATDSALAERSMLRLDLTPPVLTFVHVASSADHGLAPGAMGSTTIAHTGDSVTVSFMSSEALATSPQVWIGGRKALVASESSPSDWMAWTEVERGDHVGEVSFRIEAMDEAGNAITTTESTTDGSVVARQCSRWEYGTGCSCSMDDFVAMTGAGDDNGKQSEEARALALLESSPLDLILFTTEDTPQQYSRLDEDEGKLYVVYSEPVFFQQGERRILGGNVDSDGANAPPDTGSARQHDRDGDTIPPHMHTHVIDGLDIEDACNRLWKWTSVDLEDGSCRRVWTGVADWYESVKLCQFDVHHVDAGERKAYDVTMQTTVSATKDAFARGGAMATADHRLSLLVVVPEDLSAKVKDVTVFSPAVELDVSVQQRLAVASSDDVELVLEFDTRVAYPFFLYDAKWERVTAPVDLDATTAPVPSTSNSATCVDDAQSSPQCRSGWTSVLTPNSPAACQLDGDFVLSWSVACHETARAMGLCSLDEDAVATASVSFRVDTTHFCTAVTDAVTFQATLGTFSDAEYSVPKRDFLDAQIVYVSVPVVAPTEGVMIDSVRVVEAVIVRSSGRHDIDLIRSGRVVQPNRYDVQVERERDEPAYRFTVKTDADHLNLPEGSRETMTLVASVRVRYQYGGQDQVVFRKFATPLQIKEVRVGASGANAIHVTGGSSEEREAPRPAEPKATVHATADIPPPSSHPSVSWSTWLSQLQHRSVTVVAATVVALVLCTGCVILLRHRRRQQLLWELEKYSSTSSSPGRPRHLKTMSDDGGPTLQPHPFTPSSAQRRADAQPQAVPPGFPQSPHHGRPRHAQLYHVQQQQHHGGSPRSPFGGYRLRPSHSANELHRQSSQGALHPVVHRHAGTPPPLVRSRSASTVSLPPVPRQTSSTPKPFRTPTYVRKRYMADPAPDAAAPAPVTHVLTSKVPLSPIPHATPHPAHEPDAPLYSSGFDSGAQWHVRNMAARGMSPRHRRGRSTSERRS